MGNQYIQTVDRVFFKHEISEDLPCDAYSMHTHNAYELIYFLDGDASHVIEDRKYKLKKGDLILIRPMSYHFIQIEGQTRYERYDILFDPKAHGVEGVELIPADLEVVSLAANPPGRGRVPSVRSLPPRLYRGGFYKAFAPSALGAFLQSADFFR